MRFHRTYPNKYRLCGTGFKNCKTGDFKELDYIDADIFTPIVKIGEPKVSADKELDPNNLGEADNESHDKSNHGIFCVAGNDSECIDIDDLF